MGFFCEVCNKQYTSRTTKIKHEKTKIHTKNFYKLYNINSIEEEITMYYNNKYINGIDNLDFMKELNDIDKVICFINKYMESLKKYDSNNVKKEN